MASQSSNSLVCKLFPRGEECGFDFWFWYSKRSVKNQWGGGEGDRRPNFVIFVWSALIVCWWMIMAWGRKCCLELAEISSYVFLILFKDEMQGGSRISSCGGLQSKRCCGHEAGLLKPDTLRWEIFIAMCTTST